MSQYTQGCSIVIVSYNVAAFLYQTIASVVKAAEASVFKNCYEIIVVDNNSSDDSVALVQALALENANIKLIANQNNPGFGKANNQGFRAARYGHILILNPDTVLAEDVLELCHQFLKENTQVGAIGIKMIDGAGNYLPESKRGLPTLWNSFTKLSGLCALFPQSKLFAGYYLGHLSPKKAQEIEVLSGAFIYIRKEALEAANYFDEAYFMYGEDIDLSFKILQAGYKNYYLPHSTIIHYKGESTKKGSLNYVKAFYEAMFIFASKNLKGSFFNILKPFIYIAIYLKGLLTLLKSSLNALGLPILDAIGIYIGMDFLKTYWEINHKRVPNYYPESFMQFVVPAYIIMWLSMVWLSGGYGSNKSVFKTVRGIVISTALIAAITNFFDDYRFSKALILLGMAWAVFYLSGIRLLLNRISFSKNKTKRNQQRKYAAVIGDESSLEKVKKIYQQKEYEGEILGFIALSAIAEHQGKNAVNYLGEIQNIKKIIELIPFSELIFDTAIITHKEMIANMELLKDEGISFRMLPKDAYFILGSDSKLSSGEVSGLDSAYLINNPEIIRQKRLLDFTLAAIFLLLFPIFYTLSKQPKGLFSRVMAVFLGKKGFTALSKMKFKGIKQKEALLYYDEIKVNSFKSNELNPRLHSLMIETEAKSYSVLNDLVLITKKFRYL